MLLKCFNAHILPLAMTSLKYIVASLALLAMVAGAFYYFASPGNITAQKPGQGPSPQAAAGAQGNGQPSTQSAQTGPSNSGSGSLTPEQQAEAIQQAQGVTFDQFSQFGRLAGESHNGALASPSAKT